MARAFGPDYDGIDRTVDTHVTNLRRKIGGPSDRRFIHTIHGVGYRLGATMKREVRRSLQTQLLLAVGVLALAAVAAVALTTRFGARQEFRRFRDVERRAVADRVDSLDPRWPAARSRSLHCRPRSTRCPTSSAPTSCCSYRRRHGRSGGVGGSAAPHSLRGLGDPGRRRTRRRGDASGPGPARPARVAVPPRRHTGLGWATAGWHLYGSRSRARRDREADAFLGSVDRRLLGVTGLVGLLTIAATWFVARRTVRPLEELRAATRDLAAGRLDRRVQPRGAREVADLATSFNAMADKLEQQHTLRRTLVTDVTHELRTPLTALQCRLETMQDGLAADPALALSQAHDEVLHLTRLVTDLHELALAEARELALDVREVDSSDVVHSAVRAAGLEHERPFA